MRCNTLSNQQNVATAAAEHWGGDTQSRTDFFHTKKNRQVNGAEDDKVYDVYDSVACHLFTVVEFLERKHIMMGRKKTTAKNDLAGISCLLLGLNKTRGSEWNLCKFH